MIKSVPEIGSGLSHRGTYDNSIQTSPSVQAPRSTYHMAYVPPPVFPRRNRFGAMSRSTSLPTMQDDMHASVAEASHFDTSGPTSSLRRSVSGMKQPFPLKLASPHFPETNFWPSATSVRRATFGLQGGYEDGMNLEQNSTRLPRRKHPRLQMTIRPQKYRDTPIYTEPGSPVPGRAYYTDEEKCFTCTSPGSSCDEACIIREYESFDETSSDQGSDDDIDDLRDTVRASALKMKARSRDSDLSFKCLGQPNHMDSLYNDTQWLRSPLNRWNHPASDSLPHLLADDLNRRSSAFDPEEWISDSTRNSYYESGDDFFVSS